MDTRFLESFIAVVEMGSIAAAAHSLSITPAGVAQRLHALEQEIGTALVTRAGRTVRPTAAGLEIFERSKKLLRDIRDIKSLATSEVPSGELRLGAISTSLTRLTPNIIQAIVTEYPLVDIFILPGVSAELYEQVLKGELDAAIIVKPQFSIPKSCDWQKLRAQPLVALTPAKLKVKDIHQAIADQPFILYDTAQWGGQVVANYLRKAKIAPRVRFRLDALEGIIALVERGLGVALVPDWMPKWPRNIGVHRLPLRDSRTDRSIGVFWLRASLRIGLIKAFLEEAEKVQDREDKNIERPVNPDKLRMG